MKCAICSREFDQKDDPLSLNCGGDCWGCVGAIEAELGDELSLAKVREEFKLDLRPDGIEGTTNGRTRAQFTQY